MGEFLESGDVIFFLKNNILIGLSWVVSCASGHEETSWEATMEIRMSDDNSLNEGHSREGGEKGLKIGYI